MVDERFRAVDDFEIRLESLKKKINNFITRTTTHVDILSQQGHDLSNLAAENPNHEYNEEHLPSPLGNEPHTQERENG